MPLGLHVRAGVLWGRLLAPLALVTLAACEQASANRGPEADEINVALGKPYTLAPVPSDLPCTDPGDLQQLTDGQATGAWQYRKSTVGWKYPDSPPTIVIDLGCVEPIEEVRIHSLGGGRHGKLHPASILVMVSDDGRTFHAVAVGNNAGLAQDWFDRQNARNQAHVFRFGDLKTRGRFVLVWLEPDGQVIFIDEVQVIRGRHAPRTVTFAFENRFRPHDVSRLRSVLRARAEWSALSLALEAAWQDPACAGSLELLREMQAQMTKPRAAYDVTEVRRLTNALYTLRGRELRQREGARLSWAVVNPMVQIGPASALPDVAHRRTTLELRCWQGEYEPAAITLLNCGESPLRLRVSLSAWQHCSGAAYPSEDCVTLRQGVVVVSRSLGPIHDALVRLSTQDLVLPAGQTGQLWMTFHNPALSPGEYSFAVRIAPIDEVTPTAALPEIVIPGRLIVDPIKCPDEPSLKASNWALVRRGVYTGQALDEAIADLKAHYINVFPLNTDELPLPKRGSDGRIRVDFNRHAETLRLYDAEQYLFYWGCRDSASYRNRGVQGSERLSDEWRAVMKAWLPNWVAFLHEQGIGYDRFAMYLFDEDIGDAFYHLARFLKEEVDPRIRIFANDGGDRTGAQMRRAAPYVDIWCLPDRPAVYQHPADEQSLRANAATWTYDARGPSKALPPYGYYRLQPWRAFSRGDSGCIFYKYNQRVRRPASTWADRGCRSEPYDVIYPQCDCPVDTAGERLIPSRRWEAWREGVEDYEYLVQLRAAIESARASGRIAEANHAQTVLEQVVREVTLNPGEPHRVYVARRKLTEHILQLEGPSEAMRPGGTASASRCISELSCHHGPGAAGVQPTVSCALAPPQSRSPLAPCCDTRTAAGSRTERACRNRRPFEATVFAEWYDR